MNPLDAKLAELASRFAARAPEERNALAVALKAGDRRIVCERAHKLAGIAAMFGHPSMGEAAFDLEEAARGVGNLDAVGQRLLDLLDAL